MTRVEEKMKKKIMEIVKNRKKYQKKNIVII